MSEAKSRILVVEDDELMAGLYRKIFKGHPREFECRYASDAKAALDALSAGEVDILLLDWDLSGAVSGLDLLKAVRKNPGTSRVRVLMVSGRARTEDEVLALESGADDYLRKPFHVEVLLARLLKLARR
jgi:DNA-binding response OmpR family regulator